MKQKIKNWWMILIKGLILIALGLFSLFNPVGALEALGVYIGIGLMITGVIIAARALANHKTDDLFGWHLAEGLIDVLFALILLTSPAITAAIFPFIVGFWTIVFGAMTFSRSIVWKKAGDKQWWLSTLGGILNILIGFLIIGNPVIGALSITFWIGMGFLIYGILNTYISLQIRKA